MAATPQREKWGRTAPAPPAFSMGNVVDRREITIQYHWVKYITPSRSRLLRLMMRALSTFNGTRRIHPFPPLDNGIICAVSSGVVVNDYFLVQFLGALAIVLR
jgi:hypothetical protein